jgi:hypothetical protein
MGIKTACLIPGKGNILFAAMSRLAEGVHGGQSGTGTGFSSNPLFPLSLSFHCCSVVTHALSGE